MTASWPFFLAFGAVLTMLVIAALVDWRHDRALRRERSSLSYRLTVAEPLPVARSMNVATKWRNEKW